MVQILQYGPLSDSAHELVSAKSISVELHKKARKNTEICFDLGARVHMEWKQ